MVKHTKIIIALLSCAFILDSTEKKVTTLIRPCSATVNAALELVGLDRQIYIPHKKNHNYVVATITPEITKSFRPERIAQCLFGDDILICPKHMNTGCPEKRACQSLFLVSGSRVPDRNNNAWLADYFGLPTDFQSAVHIKPHVDSFLADFYLYYGLDALIPGLYVSIHAPIVRASWNLDIVEKIDDPGSNGYNPGYFNATGVARSDLVSNFLSFISGTSVPTIDGVIFHPLRSAKIKKCHSEVTKFSEIQAAFGYNFFYSRCHHVGINIRMSIPTGTRPHGEFLFEPIIGNCHHWEMGIGLSGHVVAWEDVCTEESFAMHAIVNITHLFNTRQRRIFDLHDRPLSRYMLAAKVDDTIVDNLRGIVGDMPVTPSFQFSNEYTSVANLTTVEVDTNVSAQVDMVFMLTYAKERFSWNMGYGFWAQSCEDIQPIIDDCCDINCNNWVLKGDAQAFGFMGADDPPLHANDPVPLSFSEHDATVHSGTNFPPATTNFFAGEKNEQIDNPELATAGTHNTRLLYAPQVSNTVANQINTSIDPIILTSDMIDFDSTLSRGVAQKLFMHVHYTLTDRECLVPHFGFGAEVVFGRSAGFPPPKECRQCINGALSYWGIWVKVGFTFE